MKTKKASLLRSLLTMIAALTVSGCYTQLAFVDDKWDITTKASSPVESQIIVVYEPIYIPPPPPPVYFPPAGVSTPVNETPSYPPTRDSGYQRSGSSSDNHATDSHSDRRTGGSSRAGR